MERHVGNENHEDEGYYRLKIWGFGAHAYWYSTEDEGDGIGWKVTRNDSVSSKDEKATLSAEIHESFGATKEKYRRPSLLTEEVFRPN